MKGQWIGSYQGTNAGLIIVNVDECPSHYEGVAYLNEANNASPSTAAFFKTQNKGNEFSFRTGSLLPINPKTGVIDSLDNVMKFYDKGVVIPNHADVTGSWSKETLTLSWTTDIGTQGSCILPCSKSYQPSELVPTISNWEGFRAAIAKMEGRRFLFRGQSEPWRLRTSFHRAERCRLRSSRLRSRTSCRASRARRAAPIAGASSRDGRPPPRPRRLRSTS